MLEKLLGKPIHMYRRVTMYVILFLLLQVSEFLQNQVGMSGVLFSYSIWCTIFTAIAFMWVPETFGGLYHATIPSANEVSIDEDDDESIQLSEDV